MLEFLTEKLLSFSHQIGRSAIVALSIGLVTLSQVAPANSLVLQPTVAIGLQHEVEGAIDQEVGKVQQQVDKRASQAQGLTRQAKGKAKRDIGRVESAAESLGNQAEAAAENTHSRLNNIGDNLEDSASGIAESVKEFFD